MLRKSAVTLAVLAAMQASQAQALGLGEVTVHSALNQPLQAEINLLQIRDLNKSQIIASLADSDDFYLAGVKPTAILSDMAFQLDIENGKGVIRLTTEDPIKEPFLNFLVEVNWPSGRLVREYTVLLDPPVFGAQDLQARPAPPAVSGAAVPPVAAQPAPRPTQPSSTAGNVAPGSTASPTTQSYRVGPEDTLWNIALNTRPDRSISPQQMMLAIQRTNPDAFIDNNINRLKSGAVLDIPSKTRILNMNASESMAEVKRQNSAWRQDTAAAGQNTSAGQQLDARKEGAAGTATGADNEQSQLRIVSPSETKESDQQAEEKNLSVDAEADEISAEERQNELAEQLLTKNQELEEQLVVTLEGLEKVERDNAELFERLEGLTDQLASMQRLIELKDQQMAQLQQQAAAPQAPVAAPPAAAQNTEKSFMDSLLGSPAIIGGALAALLALILGALFMVRKRRQRDDQAVEQAMAVLDDREQQAKPADAPPVASAAVATAAGIAAAEAAKSDETANELDTLDADDNFADSDESLEDLNDDFDSLISDDLDMDMDLDEPIENDPEMEEFAAALLKDEEYDLAADEADAETESSQATAEEADLDDGLDFVISESKNDAESTDDDFADDFEVDSDLDDMLSGSGSDFDLDSESTNDTPTDQNQLLDELQLAGSELEESNGIETVAPDSDEEDPLDDSALDDLLSLAEDEDIETEGLDEDTGNGKDRDDDTLGLSLEDDSERFDTAEADDPSASPLNEPSSLTLETDDENADEAVLSDALDLDDDVSLDEALDFGAQGVDSDESVAPEDALEVRSDDLSEFDDIEDDALENELNQMLEDENNGLALDETSESDEDDIDYLDAADELGTKLDLARAYIDMEDAEGAREILQEVLTSDDPALQAEAQKLLDDLGSNNS